MKRFYFISTIIHLLLFLWLYSTDFFGLASKDKPPQYEKEMTEKLKNEEESNFEELIKKQIEEKEERIKQVKELIEKHKPDLTKKQIENFSDVVTSSELDEEKINEITENYFGEDGNGLDGLQDELSEYLETDGSGKSEGESGEQGEGKNGSGEEESNLQVDISYEGSEIDHDMSEHTVESEENSY